MYLVFLLLPLLLHLVYYWRRSPWTPATVATILAVIVAQQAMMLVRAFFKLGFWGAEIAARVADELFEWLDAPVRRLAATDTFVGYAPQLEAEILPQVPDIAAAMEELKAY